MEETIFGWIDYGIFLILLGSSSLIGVYFAFFGGNGDATEYLFAGRKMSILPISISILSSGIGAITFLGIPTEIYLHGTVNAATMFAGALNLCIHIYVVLPVFWGLNLDHCYEYLELRFSKSAKTMASVFFIFSLIIYAPITVYASALAFSQVTGFEINTVTVTLSVICILYTSFGGIKAVIWTEILQFSFAFVGLFSILTVGFLKIGGPLEVWRISNEGVVTKYSMNPSLYERDTFWAMFTGQSSLLLARCNFGQINYQRCRSVEKRSDLNKGLVCAIIGYFGIYTGCLFTGLVLYAHYHDCDPIKAGLVKRSDQILPFFVMDVASHIPGLPGLFLAGIVSSGLSTMSAILNTLSDIIYRVVVDSWISEGTKNSIGATNFMKVICFILGAFTILLTFLIQRLGTLYEMSLGLVSMPEASLLCLFLLGLLCPWVGKETVMCGAVASLIFMICLVSGSQWHVFKGNLALNKLPTSIENCSWLTTNLTMISETKEIKNQEEPFFFFKISVLYYSAVGTLVGITMVMLLGLIWRKNNAKKRKPEYYAPFLRRFLTKTDVENDVVQASSKNSRKINWNRNLESSRF